MSSIPTSCRATACLLRGCAKPTVEGFRYTQVITVPTEHATLRSASFGVPKAQMLETRGRSSLRCYNVVESVYPTRSRAARHRVVQ